MKTSLEICQTPVNYNPYDEASAMRQKSEYQNECYKKTK